MLNGVQENELSHSFPGLKCEIQIPLDIEKGAIHFTF